MELKAYKEHRLSIIPLKTLRALKREGVVGEPLTRDDIIFLSRLEMTWGKADIIRAQMARWSVDRRLSMALSADEPAKWQRFILARCFNLGLVGRVIRGAKILDEAEEKFPTLKKERVLSPEYVEGEVRRLIRKANNLRMAYRNKQKEIEEDFSGSG
ncbi:MAG: hypothetical protein R2864_07020 [Syntrophotaleaceae bacterium]